MSKNIMSKITKSKQSQNQFLVIGGLHGNEPLGIDIVKKLETLKLPSVGSLIGNPKAIKQNTRFVDSDLNRVFPGVQNSQNLEEARAFEIIQESSKYDFILDFHNTVSLDNDCGFVGGIDYLDSLKLASFLGIKRVVVADYDCINKYVKGCLSIEVSLNSVLNKTDYWIDKIASLKNFNPNQEYTPPSTFRFHSNISMSQKTNLGLENWKAFEAISKIDKQKLGLDLTQKYYPIFVEGYTMNDTKIWAKLLIDI